MMLADSLCWSVCCDLKCTIVLLYITVHCNLFTNLSGFPTLAYFGNISHFSVELLTATSVPTLQAWNVWLSCSLTRWMVLCVSVSMSRLSDTSYVQSVHLWPSLRVCSVLSYGTSTASLLHYQYHRPTGSLWLCYDAVCVIAVMLCFITEVVPRQLVYCAIE